MIIIQFTMEGGYQALVSYLADDWKAAIEFIDDLEKKHGEEIEQMQVLLNHQEHMRRLAEDALADTIEERQHLIDENRRLYGVIREAQANERRLRRQTLEARGERDALRLQLGRTNQRLDDILTQYPDANRVWVQRIPTDHAIRRVTRRLSFSEAE